MSDPIPTLDNPLAPAAAAPTVPAPGSYEATLAMGRELLARPLAGGGTDKIRAQHARGRMTIWERIRVLCDSEPRLYWQNWGRRHDGDSIVTGILNIDGRDVALYGHDFTLRVGAMDATNGEKIARIIRMAGERGIPLIGMNESAGAFVPAGVGGLDGYSEAFYALRRVSGVVPSIMLMFGFNAGGGSYLPRQGSFLIQCDGTFFGLTGPDVVRSVLGEDVSADELGGPKVHGQSGVTDIVTDSELWSLRKALRLLSYLPDNNASGVRRVATSDPVARFCPEEDLVLRRAFGTAAGFNAPLDVTNFLQQIVDYGDYFELQPQRARNLVTAFGRIGGHTVGFFCNNSAVSSGQIDIAAAGKGTRFVRFCNLYNIPMVFLEDTTGFLPGTDQETGGIVSAGRRLLDSIIDLRTPRITVILRNAFGGAYATVNSHYIGADLVLALPTARVAVMGKAGVQYVYKNEVAAIAREHAEAIKAGASAQEADARRAEAMAALGARYEEELMNPKEALALGSVNRIVMPGSVRSTLAENLDFFMSRYNPSPMGGPQREYE